MKLFLQICCLTFRLLLFVNAFMNINDNLPNSKKFLRQAYQQSYQEQKGLLNFSTIVLIQMVKVINNYTLIQKIGEGTYGEVYRALNTKKKGQFAVKIIPAQKFQQNNLLQQCTINQVKTLSTIGPSEHIVKYQDHFQTRNNYYFVYEFCNGGTLNDAVKKQGHFSQTKALTVLRQLLQAFKVLNRFNIMHRDLKPQNIFFSNGKVKLGDFGFCKGLKPGEHMAKTMLGSPIYMAPQVLRGQNYTMKADIWSLGVVLYEMLFGVCPFQSSSIAMLINTINSNQITLPLEKHRVSPKTQTLLKKLLTKDYFRRISWVQLFSYKIDQQGNYIDNQNGTKSPFNSTNKSAGLREESDEKDHDKSNYGTDKKPSSVPKDTKFKFYSEKYMSAINEPLQTSNNSTRRHQRKISLFADNFAEKYNTKEDLIEQFQDLKANLLKKLNQPMIQVKLQQTKRSQLLNKHCECINILKGALKMLQKQQNQSIGFSYLSLLKVHQKLKEISEQIKVSQTDLLDVASLINYQIIQIDRQLIETKQELLRRKLQVPKENKESKQRLIFVTQKTIDDVQATPQSKSFYNLCLTQQNS